MSNFVAAATGVGRGRICLTSFNSQTTKTLIGARISEISLMQCTSQAIAGRFCLKFRCYGNTGHPGVNLNDTIKLADPKNHTNTMEPKITTLSCI